MDHGAGAAPIPEEKIVGEPRAFLLPYIFGGIPLPHIAHCFSDSCSGIQEEWPSKYLALIAVAVLNAVPSCMALAWFSRAVKSSYDSLKLPPGDEARFNQ